ATVAYTYTKSEDVQSLTSDRAISNWRNGRQLSVSHDDLVTTTSVFSRPHRLVAYGTYSLPWAGTTTDITLYYERTSGVPFTYVANGDLNGDLYVLSKDWGQIRLPTLSPTFNDQRALTVTGRNSGPLSQSISTFTFDNKLYDTTTGDPKPFEGRTGSVYQIQLTLRYSF